MSIEKLKHYEESCKTRENQENNRRKTQKMHPSMSKNSKVDTERFKTMTNESGNKKNKSGKQRPENYYASSDPHYCILKTCDICSGHNHTIQSDVEVVVFSCFCCLYTGGSNSLSRSDCCVYMVIWLLIFKRWCCYYLLLTTTNYY